MSYTTIKIIKTTDDGLYIASTVAEVETRIANNLIESGHATECDKSGQHRPSNQSDSGIEEEAKLGAVKKDSKKSPKTN